MTTKKETNLQALGLVTWIVLCPITLVFIWSAIAGHLKAMLQVMRGGFLLKDNSQACLT